jgi:hypothetical protein
VDEDPGSQKVIPARGRRDGSFKGVDDRHRGGQAAEPGEARAGRSKGRRGAEVFARWKALSDRLFVRSFTRADGRAISAALGWARGRANVHGTAREATGASEARYARVTAGRQRPPRRSPFGDHVRPAEANCADVHQPIFLETAPLLRRTAREPTRRGYGYEDVRWQKSVRRIARRISLDPPQGDPEACGAGRGDLRTAC